MADDDDASSCLTPTASAPGPADTRVPDVTETRPRPDVFDSTCGYEGEGPPKLRPPGRPSQGQLSQLPGAALASRSRSASVESESGFCTQLACSSSSAPPSSSAPFASLRPFCRSLLGGPWAVSSRWMVRTNSPLLPICARSAAATRSPAPHAVHHGSRVNCRPHCPSEALPLLVDRSC